MKFILALALMFSPAAFAGDKVLNGGNVVLCPGRPPQLLDYYEVELNGASLRLDPALKTWREKVQSVLAEWAGIGPRRMAQYSKWLSSFEKDAAILSNIQIPPIPDYGTVVIPVGCSLSPAAFQRRDADVFPGMKRYVIDKNLWDSMDETQKAGLVLHELVYREAIPMNHLNSLPTRYLTGLLSSTVPDLSLYFAGVSQMPLSYLEYGNANISSSNRPEIGANGLLKSGVISQFVAPSVQINSLKFEGCNSDTAYFPSGIFIRFDDDGTLLSFSTMTSNIRYEKLTARVFQSSDKSVEISCEGGGYNCLDSYQPGSLSSLVGSSQISITEKKSGSYIEHTESGFSPNGWRNLNFSWNQDFVVRPSNGDQVMETNPAVTFITKSDGFVIRNIKLIGFQCVAATNACEHTKLTTDTAVYIQKNGDWVLQK